jgi:hypothetical protein
MLYDKKYDNLIETVKLVLTKEVINENTSAIYNKILDDKSLSSFLNYLVHDKSHVMGNVNSSPQLEKVLQLVKNKKFNKPLYRGLYNEQLKDFSEGKIYQFNRYQSFSEKIGIAKTFSKNNLIIKANSSTHGFNYAKFLVHTYKVMKKNDPDQYDGEDGDYMIQSALEEAEWIFPMNAKFKVEKISKSGKFTIISGDLI